MEATNLIQIKPGEARGKFKPEYLKDGKRWVLEPKYDGIRELLHCIPGNTLNRLTSRRVSDVDGLYVEKTLNFPHLAMLGRADGQEEVFRLLQGCIFDGELVSAGANSMDMTTISGSKPERAVAIQEAKGWAHYQVFDILFHNGCDVRSRSYEARRAILENGIFGANVQLGPYFSLAPTYTENKEEELAKIFDAGGEGGILKDSREMYGVKKAWVKIKRQTKAEVFIIGYKDATEMTEKTSGEISESRYHALNWIGAIKFGQYFNGQIVEMGYCSGMDDATRKLLSENKEAYIGSVIEIDAQQRIAKTGRFRHPRFKGFRSDKVATDCVYYPEEC